MSRILKPKLSRRPKCFHGRRLFPSLHKPLSQTQKAPQDSGSQPSFPPGPCLPPFLSNKKKHTIMVALQSPPRRGGDCSPPVPYRCSSGPSGDEGGPAPVQGMLMNAVYVLTASQILPGMLMVRATQKLLQGHSNWLNGRPEGTTAEMDFFKKRRKNAPLK